MDPSGIAFWSVVGVGYLVLTPWAEASRRQRVFGALNLWALGLLLGPNGWLWYAVLVATVRRVLQQLLAHRDDPARRVTTAAVGGMAVLGVAFALWHLLAALGHAPKGLMALGFSYLTLRGVYLVRGVWEGRFPVPSWLDTVSYLTPFSMLLAGPIQTYEEFRTAFQRASQREDVLIGVERIADGLFKKFVLADGIQAVFLTDFSHPGWAFFLLEIHLSFLRLYLDFSGYSDIAVGVGKILGFQTPENFRSPLRARNLIDFWERWHITLSRFIRTEVFMPLQFALMRRPRWQERPLEAATLSFTLAFLLCGLWHQVYLSFLVWGLFHGLGLSACKIYQTLLARRWGAKRVRAWGARPAVRLLSQTLTLEFVTLSWLLVTLPSTSPWYPTW